jgi:hypothetical protein
MSTATDLHTRSLPVFAVAAGATGLLCTLIGTYFDTPYHVMGPKRWGLNFTDRHIGEFLILIGFAVLGAAVIFGVVVRTSLRREPDRTARYSLIVAIIGAGSLLVFWSGLPAILAAGAVIMADDARTRLGRAPKSAVIAMGIAALTVIAAVWIAFTG